MPAYRLRTTDGRTRPVAAGRVVVAGDELRFQSPGTGGWVTVDSAPLSTVLAVERRLNEADGRVQWVNEPEVSVAAAAVRPAPSTAAVEDSADRRPREQAQAAASPPAEPASASARDVRCPQCSEQEELSGRRADGAILLTCGTCGYEGPRVARRRCPTCGGDDVVERPKAVVERSRGTQLSIVGWTTVGLCRRCDAPQLAAALARGGAVLPDELPTVDPQTLRDLGRGAWRPPPG